jgi:CheY-like chemotaxis protein
LSERQARGLQVIDESGRHLLRLIDDILDMARIDAGKLVLQFEEVDLAAFLRGVCDIIGVKAEEKGLLFSYRADGTMPTGVRVDDKRLRQVLLNLLSNAIKFTDSGEVTLFVQATALPARAAQAEGAPAPMVRLRFEVRDDGIGMSEAQMARLFQPFEQVADTQRREGGTGLGLAISRKLVRMMGGDIQVRSGPGEGSVFSFELDLPTALPHAALATYRGTPTGYEGPRKRVLVVDDVPQNRAMMFEALSSLGFDVISAGDGETGIDLAVTARPDLVVMDAMMPVMDGCEATRRLRRLPALADLPIIATSASATQDVESRCLAAGANAFISKPIEHDALVAALKRLLDLTWIYEEPQPRPAWSGATGGSDSDLVYPPVEELKVLRNLARTGNMRSIRERAEHLRQLDARYAAFASRLAALAEACQSRAITALVEAQPP